MKMCAWCGMVIMGTDWVQDMLTKKLYHASCARYAIEFARTAEAITEVTKNEIYS